MQVNDLPKQETLAARSSGKEALCDVTKLFNQPHHLASAVFIRFLNKGYSIRDFHNKAT